MVNIKDFKRRVLGRFNGSREAVLTKDALALAVLDVRLATDYNDAVSLLRLLVDEPRIVGSTWFGDVKMFRLKLHALA